MDTTAKTAGIAPAKSGALNMLQFARAHEVYSEIITHTPEQIQAAAAEVSSYHAPKGDQADRHASLSIALADFLVELVKCCPPGPERSTAISRAREAKMWASAAVALEGL